MSFSERYTADLRLMILEILQAAGEETSLALLKAAVSDASMHRPSSEDLVMEVSWLATRNLIVQRKISGVVDAVVITERGRDVAEGASGCWVLHAPVQ